jgi:hypothetical protein
MFKEYIIWLYLVLIEKMKLETNIFVVGPLDMPYRYGCQGQSKGWGGAGPLPGASARKGRQDVTWITWNVVLVNSGFTRTKKISQKFGYAPSKFFTSPVLGQNTSKNIGLKGEAPLWACPGCPHILGWHRRGYRCCFWQDEGNSMKSSRGNKSAYRLANGRLRVRGTHHCTQACRISDNNYTILTFTASLHVVCEWV